MPPQSCTRGVISVGAERLVMIIGTRYRAQRSMSWLRRSFDLWMIWLTANGAALHSEFAASCVLSSVVIRSSHSSSCSFGRALRAGKAPTTPEIHWAMTRSGLEMMNSGAPMTGSRRCLRISGFDIGVSPRVRALAGRLENPGRLGDKPAFLVMYVCFDKDNSARRFQDAPF